MFYRSVLILFFFFFSSRRRHTRYIGDWSSDVCSSDLAFVRINGVRPIQNANRSVPASLAERLSIRPLSDRAAHAVRSEERRVGKECRWRWWGGWGEKRACVVGVREVEYGRHVALGEAL